MRFPSKLVRRMWWVCAALVVGAAGLVAMASASGRPAAGAEATKVLEMRIEDVINPVMADFVSEGFDEAVKQGAKLVLITMNTPGGMDSSMREIIQRVIASPVPVAIYVTPSGTRAASAGYYILLSADVAAMSPGTNTGAASPIFVLGGQPVQIDETLRKKAVNDAAAYLRSITGKRGRNPQLAETAVTEAKAFTEKEALDGKLIDLIAGNTEELLAQLNGRTIQRFDGKSMTLELPNPVRTSFEMNTRQRLLARLAQPDLLFILIVLALLGLYIEFNHPGLILPGVVGGVSLILVLVAIQILPVNAIGVVLILLAVVLFVLEAKLTSHGLLGFAGAVAMIFGALMLIKSPITGAGVSLKVAVIVTLPFALICVFLMRMVFKSFKWKPSTGMEEMVGESGEVTTAAEKAQADGTYRGMAFVHGELWRIAASRPLPKGAMVRVMKVEGLTLHVEEAQKEVGTAK